MLLTEGTAAERLAVSPKLLRKWRQERRGPYWVDLNNRGRNQATAHEARWQRLARGPLIRYPAEELDRWAAGRDQTG